MGRRYGKICALNSSKLTLSLSGMVCALQRGDVCARRSRYPSWRCVHLRVHPARRSIASRAMPLRRAGGGRVQAALACTDPSSFHLFRSSSRLSRNDFIDLRSAESTSGGGQGPPADDLRCQHPTRRIVCATTRRGGVGREQKLKHVICRSEPNSHVTRMFFSLVHTLLDELRGLWEAICIAR